jgi:hypothetical protein
MLQGKDAERIREFLMEHRPHIVAVGATGLEARQLKVPIIAGFALPGTDYPEHIVCGQLQIHAERCCHSRAPDAGVDAMMYCDIGAG